MAFYCLGAVAACSTEAPEPKIGMTPPTPPPKKDDDKVNTGITGTTSGNVNFTVDLNNKDFTTLKTVGNFTYVDNIILINAVSGFVALSKVCTHTGTTVEFRKSQNDILCPNHGSEFKLDGSVQKSPAPSPLTMYKASVSMDGNTLTVKS